MVSSYRLRLFENYRFVLYAPFYAAHALGAYAEEGVEVELLPSPGPGSAEAALSAGEVDVGWMGPIRLMKQHDENPASPLVAMKSYASRGNPMRASCCSTASAVRGALVMRATQRPCARHCFSRALAPA